MLSLDIICFPENYLFSVPGLQKATGSYRTYSITCKTAALVPLFAVKDLPSAELQPRFLRLQRRTCPWAEDSDYDDDPWTKIQVSGFKC